MRGVTRISGIASWVIWCGSRSSRRRFQPGAALPAEWIALDIVTIAVGQPVTGTISGNPVAHRGTGGAVNNLNGDGGIRQLP
jgi:hypothetical protein